MADPITVSNPPAAAPNGVAGFFNFLGQALGQAATGLGQNALAEMNARSTAKVQEILNRNKEINRAIGANDPAAAQAAANRTFLEKFLPADMLYSTDASDGSRTPTPYYYGIMAGIAVLVVLLVVRLLRR